MTAFVFQLDKDRATITSETAASLMGSTVTECGFVGKVYSIPHLRLAICGRGPLQIVWQAYAALVGAMDLRDADEALERLPGILQDVTEDFAYDAGIADWRKAALVEVYAFAWSPKRRHVVGFGLINYQKDFALQAIPHGTVHTVPVMGDLRPKTNDHVALMRAMQAAFGQGQADIRIGGEILSHTVSERDMGVRSLGRFADYEATAGRAAAGFKRYDVDDMPSAETFPSIAEAVRVSEEATNVVPIRPDSGMNRHQKRQAEKAARRAGKRR
ncbi:MAG: hypothetical protein ACRC67_03885 [Inquilinus sp.]|uniref:hypothetical protein n=1 Tax=Inquilinus sp. TaxID=1932117 RepID=UPI003F37D9F6